MVTLGHYLTVSGIQTAEPVVIDATAGNQHCQAMLDLSGYRTALTCRTG